MRNFTRLFSLATLMLGTLSANAAYEHITGTTSHEKRFVGVLTVKANGTQIGTISTGVTRAGNRDIYFDCTPTSTSHPTTLPEVNAGSIMDIQCTTGGGEWMHSMIYVDYDNDGTFEPLFDNTNHCLAEGSELVAFNCGQIGDTSWRNSAGVVATGDEPHYAHIVTASNGTKSIIPTFTIPATLPSGEYRVRYKVDWTYLDDPTATATRSSNSMSANGGAMIDFIIKVVGAHPTLNVTAPSTATWVVTNASNTELANGADLTVGEELDLVITVADGYLLNTVTVNGSAVTATKNDDGTYSVHVTATTAGAVIAITTAERYQAPAGNKGETNCYVATASTSGAAHNINITRSAQGANVWELVTDDVIEVNPGMDFSLRLQAKNANNLPNSKPSPQDLRYCVAYVFADWDGDGVFELQTPTTTGFTDMYHVGYFANKSGFDIVKANYDEVLDFTHNFSVPADAAIGQTRIRVIYTEAWDRNIKDKSENEADRFIPGNYQTIDKGIAYDYLVNVVSNTYNPTLELFVNGQGSVDIWSAMDNQQPSGEQFVDGNEVTSDRIYVFFRPQPEQVVERIIVNGEEIEVDELESLAQDTHGENTLLVLVLDVDKSSENLQISVTFSTDRSGIEGVGEDVTNAPAEYYNIQGVRVAADSLIPGVYVVKTGNKVAKVLVK